MLTIFRRHLKKCSHRGKGRNYRRCKCPCWIDGFIGRVEVRESLKTANWEKANSTMQSWEARGSREEIEVPESLTIVQACDKFKADAIGRELTAPTLEKYTLLFKRLQKFADDKSLRYVSDLDLDVMREFRNGWSIHNITAAKTLERLKAFLRFAYQCRWITDNFAPDIKAPKVKESPTLPLTKANVADILGAISIYPDRANSVRLHALVLLLRYSGLRIRDAVTLRRDRIQEGKVFLYQAKDREPVWVPLPPAAIDALDAIPLPSTAVFSSGRAWVSPKLRRQLATQPAPPVPLGGGS